MFVIDASVLIADLRPSEPHHEAARALMDACAALEALLHAPEIAVVEVASGLSRGTGSAGLATKAARLLRQQQGIQFTSIDRSLADRATVIAAEGRVRSCDAVYLALAEALDQPLVSLDRQQRERAPQRISTRTPAEMIEVLGGT